MAKTNTEAPAAAATQPPLHGYAKRVAELQTERQFLRGLLTRLHNTEPGSDKVIPGQQSLTMRSTGGDGPGEVQGPVEDRFPAVSNYDQPATAARGYLLRKLEEAHNPTFQLAPGLPYNPSFHIDDLRANLRLAGDGVSLTPAFLASATAGYTDAADYLVKLIEGLFAAEGNVISIIWRTPAAGLGEFF